MILVCWVSYLELFPLAVQILVSLILMEVLNIYAFTQLLCYKHDATQDQILNGVQLAYIQGFLLLTGCLTKAEDLGLPFNSLTLFQNPQLLYVTIFHTYQSFFNWPFIVSHTAGYQVHSW